MPTSRTAQHAGPPPDRAGSHRRSLGELRGTVAELLRILSVRRWMFFIPFCLATTAAFILSLYVPRRYVSSTMFERRDDGVLMRLPRTEATGTFGMFLRTLPNDVKNIDTMVEVVHRVGLAEGGGETGTNPQAADARVRAMAAGIASRLSVFLHEKSTYLDRIEIRYTTDTPDKIAQILDEVRDGYIRLAQKRFGSFLRRTREWFEKECAERWAVVEKLEDDQDRFTEAHHGLNPLHLNSSFLELASLRVDLTNLERKRKDLRTQLDGRKRSLESGTLAPPDQPPVDRAVSPQVEPVRVSAETKRLSSELRRVRSKIEGLGISRGMTELHPEMIALREEEQQLAAAFERQVAWDAQGVIDTAPSTVSDLVERVVDPFATARLQAENEVKIFEQLIAASEADIETANARIEEYEAVRREAFASRGEFRERESDIDRLKGEMVLYQENINQIRRLETAEFSRRGLLFEKIKPASSSSVPASPRLETITIFALAAGVAAGVVLVLLSELFDRTVRTRRQVVQELGLPILESINEIVSAAVRRRRLLTRALFVPALTTTFVLMVLLSGTVAYLSLRNRPLYQRVLEAPRSAWMRIAHHREFADPVALARVDGKEQPG